MTTLTTRITTVQAVQYDGSIAMADALSAYAGFDFVHHRELWWRDRAVEAGEWLVEVNGVMVVLPDEAIGALFVRG